MKEVVYLLVNTIIVLGFIAGDIIPLFRNSMDVIDSIAQKEYENQKIKSDVLLPLEKSTVMGDDVVSVIRYYREDVSVTVEVTVGGVTKVYVNDDYDPVQFVIPYDIQFDCSYEYDGDKLIKAIYIEK